MAEVLNRQFKVVHTTWQAWLSSKVNINPWGPRFSNQWTDNRGHLRRSENSDLGSVAQALSVNSDYGSARQNLEWINMIFVTTIYFCFWDWRQGKVSLIFSVVQHIHNEIEEGVDLSKKLPETSSGQLSEADEFICTLKRNFIGKLLKFRLK